MADRGNDRNGRRDLPRGRGRMLRAWSAYGGWPDHYRMQLWPLPPLIVIAFMAYVLYKILTTDPTPPMVAIASIHVGVIWFAVFVRPKQGERWTLPDP